MSKGRGKKIAIKFDKALLGDVAGNHTAFTVTGQQKNPLHTGTPELTAYTVDSVERYPVGVLYEDDFEQALRLGIDQLGRPANWGFYNHGEFTTGSQAADRVYGWAFTLSQDIKIDKLRIYPTKTKTYKIDIWDSTTQLNVASVNISATQGLWNEAQIDSVNLTKDREYRISFDYTGGDGQYNAVPQSSMFDPLVTYKYAVFAAGNNVYPSSAFADVVFGIVDFSIAAEPTTYTTPGEISITPIPADTLPTDPRLKWTEDLPTGTSITAEYAVNQDGLTTPETWTAINNTDLLTIPDPSTGYFLWLRFTLATEDTTATPTLLSVWLEEAEAPPDTILLTMTETGRFNDTEGALTVAYNQALGNLAGTRPVESFEHSFTPTELEPTPVSEHTITVSGSPVVHLLPYDAPPDPDYESGRSPGHTIAATARDILVDFIHVDYIVT